MATDVGIKLKIEGEKEYKQSLSSIIASQKEWESEIKAVDSALEAEASQEEKNRKKSELLTKSIESQEEKLKLMKDQLQKVEDAYGADSKEAKTLRTNINKATTALNKMKSEAKTLSQKMNSVGKSLQSAGKKMQSFGDGMTKYVSGPIGALAGLSVAAFNEVDAGMDIVVKKTGATGQALEELQQSAKNIATTIPTSFETAGSAVGEVNTKFGLVGEDLEDLSAKFIKFAELNDTDVSSAVDNTQKVMQAFGLETKDAGKLLDVMNATGQNTGISMDSLASTMVKNATSLSEMGMSAADAAQFLGQVEMSGAPVETVMKGMKTAMTEAAKDGKTLPEMLSEFQSTMESSATDQEKLNAAIDTFGKQAGPAIYQACKEGSLSFEDLYNNADEYLGNIETTFDNTLDAPDRMQVALNKVKDAGSDIGTVLLEMAAGPVEEAAKAVEGLGKWFDSLDEDGQKAVGNIAAALIVGGPAVKVAGGLVGAVGKVVEKIGGAGGLIATLGNASGAAGGLGSAASALAGAGAPIAALAGTVAWAAFVVKSMTGPIKASNQDVIDLINTQKENVEALDKAMQDVNDAITTGNASIQEVNDQADMALSLVDELETLQGQAHRTAAEEAHMQSIISQLNKMYPDLNINIDESTGSINTSTTAIRKYIKQARNMALIEAYTRASSDAMDALVAANNKLYLADKGQQALIAKRDAAESAMNALIGLQKAENTDIYKGRIADLQNDINALDADIADGAVTLSEYREEVSANEQIVADWNEQIDIQTENLNESTEAIDENGNAAEDATGKVEGLTDANGELAESAEDAAEDVEDAAEQMKQAWQDTYNSAYNSLGNSAGVFEAFGEQVETSAEQMAAGLQNQLSVYTNYSENLAKAIEIAGNNADSETGKVVQAIIDMGIDGAAYLDALVTASENNSEEFNTIISTFGDVESAKETIATQIADFSVGTVEALDVSTEAEAVATDNYKAAQAAASAVGHGASSKVHEIETAVDSLTGEVDNISGDIDSAAKDIKTSSNNSVLGMIGGMLLNQILLKATAAGVTGTVTGIGKSIDDKKESLKKSGSGSVSAVADGMDASQKDDLEPAEKRVETSVKTTTVTIGQMQESFKQSGQMVVKGLVAGMDAEAQNAYNKATAIANFIRSHINDALKIKSPSRVTMETGKYVAEGLALGMEKQMPIVKKASTMLGHAAVPFGATGSDVVQIRAEAFGGLDVDSIYAAVRSGAMDGQQPVVISEKSFKRALVGMGVQVA